MEAVIHSVYLLLLVVFSKGFHVVGPSGPLTVQLGDSVLLPCFVETPLPMEELEVEWKRNDSGNVVHMWKDGESRPEAQNHRYYGRAHFFTEEMTKGNFSLFLINVTREDAGVYKCGVYTNQGSDDTLIEINEIERLIVSEAHVISAYAGEDITLNCSVDSHIPPANIEEVTWKKMDEDIFVLIYQNGEVQPESADMRYKDRVQLFTEEINKGNFSLRLKDVRTEDKGLYMCLVFAGDLSDSTTVEVQELGFSSMHIGIFFVLGLVVVEYLILGFLSFKYNDDSRRARVIQYTHIIPNVTMLVAFILWGVTEGFFTFTETLTCSALTLLRILFLFWITVQVKTYKEDEDYLPQFIHRWAILLQYAVITGVAYIPRIVEVWSNVNTVMKVMFPVFLLVGPFITVLNVYDISFYMDTPVDWNIPTLSQVLLVVQILWPFVTLLSVIPLFNILGVFRIVSTVEEMVIPVTLVLVVFMIGQSNYGYRYLYGKWSEMSPWRKVYVVTQILTPCLTLLSGIVVGIIVYVGLDINTVVRVMIAVAALVVIALIIMYVTHIVFMVSVYDLNCTVEGIKRLLSNLPFVKLLMNLPQVCGRRTEHKRIAVFSYIMTESINLLRIILIILLYGLHLKHLVLAVCPPLAVCCFVFYFIGKRQFLIWISVMITLQVLSTSGSIYIHYELVKNVNEHTALICVTVFLHILTLMTLFTWINDLSVEDFAVRNNIPWKLTELLNTKIDPWENELQLKQRQESLREYDRKIKQHRLQLKQRLESLTKYDRIIKQPLSYLVTFGSVLVVLVNAATLLAELILKARNGQSTVDLRIILLPTESVFAVCCLTLQLYVFWKKHSEGLSEMCGCKQRQQTSPPPQDEHELESLNRVDQSSGSKQ